MTNYNIRSVEMKSGMSAEDFMVFLKKSLDSFDFSNYQINNYNEHWSATFIKTGAVYVVVVSVHGKVAGVGHVAFN